MTIFGAANSARIISCGIDDFAPIIREIIDTRGLSIPFHCSELSDLLDGTIEGPHTCTPYNMTDVSKVSKSHNFVRGSWKRTCEQIFSILPIAVIALFSLVLVASLKESAGPLKNHPKVSVVICILHYISSISKSWG